MGGGGAGLGGHESPFWAVFGGKLLPCLPCPESTHKEKRRLRGYTADTAFSVIYLIMQHIDHVLQDAVDGHYEWGFPKLSSVIKDRAATVFAEIYLERLVQQRSVEDMSVQVLEGVSERELARATSLQPGTYDLSKVETPGKGLGGRPVFIDGYQLSKKGPIKPNITAVLHVSPSQPANTPLVSPNNPDLNTLTFIWLQHAS